MSTVTPQPRRRRFAERELLDRLRQYEQLLRENHIEFKPIHPPATSVTQEVNKAGHDDVDNVALTGKVFIESSGKSEPA